MLNNIAVRDPRQLKRDIRSVVLCVSAFIITMTLSSVFVIVGAAFVSHPEVLEAYSVDITSLDATADTSETEAQLLEAIVEATDEFGGLASIVGIVLGLPWFFLLRGKSFLTTDVTRVHSRARIGTLAILLVFIFGIQLLMSLIQIGLEPLFEQTGGSLTDALDESTHSLATSFWGVLYIVLVGPICEELVFRGAVMRKLERYGANFAIILSSLLFGLYHIILFQAVFAFFIGLVLAYTAGRFSLKWAILLHIINNGLAALSVALSNEYFDVALGICYILALVATIVILIVYRKYLFAQRQAGAPSEPQVFARAFSSPWLIAYIALTVLGGIQLIGFG